MRLRNLLFGVLGIFLTVLATPSLALAICEGPDYGAEAVAACAAGSVVGAIDDPEACKKVACYIQNGLNSGGSAAKWYAPNTNQFSQKVFGAPDEEVFGERYTYAQVNWILNSLYSMINPFAQARSVGEIFEFFTALGELISSTETPTLQQYARFGPAGYAMATIQWIYLNPPVSGTAYTKDVIAKVFSIVPPVQAQGVGFAKLGQGSLPGLWGATRNIAYLLIAILTIASGFLVMFRSKVNPQTIITVQMVIPKIVITLILITFSYAIVGFVIDMIYVVITAFLGLLYTANPNIFAGGTNGIGFNFAVTQFTGGHNFSFIILFLLWPVMIAVLLLLALVIVPFIAVIPEFGLGIVVGIMPILTAAFGIFAWAIYVVARVLGQLLTAYLNLSLLTISGPLQIVTDILPNNKTGGFVGWIKCVIGNASVFVSYAVLGIVATALFRFDFLFSLGWVPGALGFNNTVANPVTVLQPGFTLPGIGGLPLGFLGFNALGTDSLTGWLLTALLGMGYFTVVPNIVAGIRDAFCKGEDTSKFLESLVKDTVGSITKAGQSGADSYGKKRESDAAALAAGAGSTSLTRPAATSVAASASSTA